MRSRPFIRIAGIRVGQDGVEGRVYGRLTALGPVFATGANYLVVCKCECGTVLAVHRCSLTTGITVGCGCFRRDQTTTHGCYKTPEYKAWTAMKTRCLNPKDHQYHMYGGRGITVCATWIESFENFIADMGSRPTGQHSLDRIDNSLGYSPGNCRWATRKEQSNNTRANVKVTLYGKARSVIQWSEISQVPEAIIRKRLYRGWEAKRAVFYMDDKTSMRVNTQRFLK